MATGFNFAGPAGEQVFSASPQISDILARYFGSPPSGAAAGAAPGAGTGEGGTIGGTPLGHSMVRADLGTGAHGTGFGSDNGVAGEASAFADRNTAVNPSFTGSLALAGSLLPGGLGIPLAGPLGSLALSALGINTGDILGGLGQTLGIGGSPFNVAGPSLSPEAIAGVLNSISGLPASAPRVTVMNALNDALAEARSAAGVAGNTGSGVGQPGNAPATGGVDLGGLAGRMGGASGSPGIAGSGVGGIVGGDTRADPGAGGGGNNSGGAASSGGGGLSGGGPRGF